MAPVVALRASTRTAQHLRHAESTNGYLQQQPLSLLPQSTNLNYPWRPPRTPPTYIEFSLIPGRVIARNSPLLHRSTSRPRIVGKIGLHLPKTPIVLAADTFLRRTGPSTTACTPDGRGVGGLSRLFSCPGRRRTSRSKNRSRKSSPYPPVGGRG